MERSCSWHRRNVINCTNRLWLMLSIPYQRLLISSRFSFYDRIAFCADFAPTNFSHDHPFNLQHAFHASKLIIIPRHYSAMIVIVARCMDLHHKVRAIWYREKDSRECLKRQLLVCWLAAHKPFMCIYIFTIFIMLRVKIRLRLRNKTQRINRRKPLSCKLSKERKLL